jgi:hypothetical protein
MRPLGMRWYDHACAGLVLLTLVGAATASDPAALLPVVPGAANAIVAIDVESLLKTELAARHNWSNKAELEYAERPVLVPSEASAVAIAASLDPNNSLAIQWQISVAEMKEKFDIPELARWEGGYPDRIAGANAAWTPSNCYLVELPGQQLGLVSPASRQGVARWLERLDAPSAAHVSNYLQRAAQQSSPTTQLVLAIDLEHAVAPHFAKEAVGRSQVLFKESRRHDEFQKQLAALTGLTLKVAVTSHAEGELRIDFATPPRSDSLVKAFILEALDQRDLHLDELEQWSLKADGNALVLSGRFSPEGLRRVGSLLQLPTTKFDDLEGVAPAESGSQDYVLRSQQYYRAVCTLIDDLNKTLKQSKDGHSVWLDRYGQKVDALPILNVDDELLAWGASVAETFRTMALVQRSSGLRQGVRKSETYGSYRYGNYYDNRQQSSDSFAIQRQEQAVASKQRFESWKELEDSRAEVRRVMTKKYNVEF